MIQVNEPHFESVYTVLTLLGKCLVQENKMFQAVEVVRRQKCDVPTDQFSFFVPAIVCFFVKVSRCIISQIGVCIVLLFLLHNTSMWFPSSYVNTCFLHFPIFLHQHKLQRLQQI